MLIFLSLIGFSMVKKYLGATAFFGRGSPKYFMTDNCDAGRNALKTVWPNSKQYLSIFHLLQQIWRWVLDIKHDIKKSDRQELMAVAKELIYATSDDKFKIIWEAYENNPLSETYPSFTR